MFRKVLVLTALLVMPVMAKADNIAQDAGPFEFTLGGSGTADKSVHSGGGALSGSFGWFATPNIELSLRDAASYSDFGTGHSWNNNVRVAVDLDINLDRFQPFVGANVGYIAGNTVRHTGEAAPEAGLKFFLNKSTFLYGMAEYNFFFHNGSTNFNNGQFLFGAGLGFRF